MPFISKKNYIKFTTEDEYSMTYSFDVGMDMLNGNGVMKPYGYESIINVIAEKHLKKLGLSFDELSQDGIAWVIISSTIEIINPVSGEMTLQGRTWYSGQKGLTFRRDFSFTDNEGNAVFNATLSSVLIDLNTRMPVRPSRINNRIDKPNRIFSVENVNTRVNYPNATELYEQRNILPSFIDNIGHVNNSRYGEFIYDAFSEKELENTANLRRMEIHFVSELVLGETLSIYKSDDEKGTVTIEGKHTVDDKDTMAFSSRLTFALPNDDEADCE